MPDDRAQAAEQTRRLRARFPRWGILFDPLESVWVAVRGRRTLVAASSPEMLGERVEAAARGEDAPDEGEKTQTWRAPPQAQKRLNQRNPRIRVGPGLPSGGKGQAGK